MAICLLWEGFEAGAQPPPDTWMFGPEIWRLPPVEPDPTLMEPLKMPLLEELPTPPGEPFSGSHPGMSAFSLMPEEGPVAIEPDAEKPKKLWDGNVNLGMDGSEGNSETFNITIGVDVKRKTKRSVLTGNLNYIRQTANTIAKANQMNFDGRAEHLLPESRWSLFVHETVDYDEFQSYNVQDTTALGIGYDLVKNDATTLIGRLGGGFSHLYGGPDDGQYTPEIVFGLQLEQQIGKRQKLVGMMEYAPDVGEFLRYRLRAQAAMDFLLDEEKHLGLRIGVLERYNSFPNGALANDLDYATMLMWKF